LNIINDVVAEGINLDVGISLDGIGKAHDEIRGIPGCFSHVNYLVDDLIRLKKELKKMGSNAVLNVCLGMTISNLTIKQYPEIKAYAKSKGLPLEYAWVEQTPYYDNQYKELGISKKGTRKVVEDLPDSPRKESWLKWIDGKDISFDCFALRTFVVVRYDGMVAPCLHYYKDVVGNLKTHTMTEILDNEHTKYCEDNIVKPCKGCLNTWAYAESHMAKLTPYMKYYLKHPKVLWKEVKK
jgi:MoaA/NifB/PqqE/SkfB family radical SAM enzyme